MNLIKNLADMFFENLAIVVVVIGLIKVAKQIRLSNYTEMVITLIVTAILAALCGTPELFLTIGNQIINAAS